MPSLPNRCVSPDQRERDSPVPWNRQCHPVQPCDPRGLEPDRRHRRLQRPDPRTKRERHWNSHELKYHSHQPQQLYIFEPDHPFLERQYPDLLRGRVPIRDWKHHLRTVSDHHGQRGNLERGNVRPDSRCIFQLDAYRLWLLGGDPSPLRSDCVFAYSGRYNRRRPLHNGSSTARVLPLALF